MDRSCQTVGPGLCKIASYVKAHLHIERETRNRANLRETRGEIPTTHKARNRAGYENQP